MLWSNSKHLVSLHVHVDSRGTQIVYHAKQQKFCTRDSQNRNL